MAKKRREEPTDSSHLLVVGLPVAIVMGVLIVGAVLQSGPAPRTEIAVEPTEEQPLPPPPAYEQRQWRDTALDENALEEETPPKPVEPAPARPVRREPPAVTPTGDDVSRLARRVMEDLDRLQATGDEWTAQIGVYCDDQRISDLVQSHGNAPDLYVLPLILNDRACFRVCWGHYSSKTAAEQTRDLPTPFRGEKPLPRQISKVVE